MTKENNTKAGVSDAWDFWLSQHPVSVPEIIHNAIKDSFDKWLDENTDRVVDALIDYAKAKIPAE